MSPFMSQLQSRLKSHPSDTDSHSDKNISLPSERIFECSLSSVVKFSTDDKNANGQNFFFFHLLKSFFVAVTSSTSFRTNDDNRHQVVVLNGLHRLGTTTH